MKAVLAGYPDAIQLSPGTAEMLQTIPIRKPSLVLRVDTTNIFSPSPPNSLPGLPRFFSQLIDRPVETALRLDAVAIVVNLLDVPNEPTLLQQCIQNLVSVKTQCDQFGMPLMVETLCFTEVEGKFVTCGMQQYQFCDPNSISFNLLQVIRIALYR